MKTLVTGGAGYIGSHVVVALIEAGHEVEVLDDLSNSRAEVLDAIEKICGYRPVLHARPVTEVGAVLADAGFGAVAHLAGLKSVEDSMHNPCEYYQQNVGGAAAVCKAMAECGVPLLLFSSSACVYGNHTRPQEATPTAPCSPYGHSKLFCERVIQDACRAHGISAVCLRYFNPAGAHPSGLLGDRPRGAAKNLMPLLCAAARGEALLKVFGKHLPTVDGSPVRDYVHVVDLAEGHLAALGWLEAQPRGEFRVVNLGSGCGMSVLQMASEMAMVSEREIRMQLCSPRPGDAPRYVADVSLARSLFGWSARFSPRDMCADAWRSCLKLDGKEHLQNDK